MPPKLIHFFAGLFLNLLLFTACGQAEKVPFLDGTWAVSDHRAAQISAMGREEADSWTGKIARYTKEQASFDGKKCASPVYKRRLIQTEEFYSAFKISPVALGDEQGPIEVIEVYCGPKEWMAPGGTLIRAGENKLFAFWDGMFFQLERKNGQ